MTDKKYQGSVPAEVKQAWDIVIHAPMEVHRKFGGRPCDRSVHVVGEEKERQLEGIVHAPGSLSARKGPVVTEIKCRDGAVWVIDYDDQSPYHAFAGREVIVRGVPCEVPIDIQQVVERHFDVSTMRLVEATPDAWLTEVGAAQNLSGRFEDARDAGKSALSFVTEEGHTFLVANNPAGVTAGCPVRVLAYSVKLSRWISRSPQQYLWVICPWSYADLDELRGGPNAGLPSEFYLDGVTGQVRHRQGSADTEDIADSDCDTGT